MTRFSECIVGAYAAMPTTQAESEKFYTALSQSGFVTGIEVPWLGTASADDPDWRRLAGQLSGRFRGGVVTAIPGTMKTLAHNPDFGIGSTDSAGRAAGIAFITQVLRNTAQLNDVTGEETISRVAVHSAPSRTARVDALRESLAELVPVADSYGIALIIEHCDAYDGVGPGEKEFLTLDEEITACADTNTPITINWGRSVVESHDVDKPAKQVKQLKEAGLLGGIMCSGAGPAATQYGPAWADAHLPLSTDEPSSWMTPDKVAEFCAATAGAAVYHGIKIQVPKDADIETRIGMLRSVYSAMTNPVET
ncbi:DUF4862 family protein [Corynebacterium epidermidicanis]|uniref:DUF4862 family protein n=1 Tax=Corynebacterium epidermidicanis TaxID=1050174 RepID=A0A0G3GRX5_9CORY|nr:DUF4862 family protein [Corynebacterium epidermidicanis]AKK02288.1 hypothetical protein CEPID_02035 [Corynebacterium epidermidicanis]